MISNNSQEIISVPATNNPSVPQVTKPPTYYDYLTLIPAILTAATPLILGLRKKDKDKKDNS